MIAFDCPKCGKHIQIAESAAGKIGVCKGCQGKVRVPNLQTERPLPSIKAPTPESVMASVNGTAEQESSLAWLEHGPQPDAAATPLTDDWLDMPAIDDSPAGDVTPAVPSADDLIALASSQPQNPERLRPCPDCGKSISVAANECPHCAHPFRDKTTQPTAGPLVMSARLSRSILKTLVAAVGVLTVIFSAIMDTTIGSGDERVHNLGLLATQEIGVIIGMGLIIVGCIPSSITLTRGTDSILKRDVSLF